MTTKIDIIRLKFLAMMGNAEAMYTLGANFLYGIGVDVNLAQAHSYIEKAAAKGLSAAKDLMTTVFANEGKSFELEPEFKKDGYEMVKIMCQSADKGDPSALHLKSMFRLSDNTDDFHFYRAVKDMEKACKQDFAPALYSLGVVYERGNRIKGKQQEGLSMILCSAEKEYIPALRYMMGIWPEKIFPTIKRMAEKDGEALYMLSQYYRDGLVVDKNTEEFVNLLMKSAEKQFAGAWYDLGILHEFGQYGVTRNVSKAVEFYEKGVALDDADCMINLGCILETSKEYPNDKKRAFELYSKAAEKENGSAYNNLGTCYKRGIGTDVDKEASLEYYIKAAEMGILEAYWNLYMYYMDEICIPRDYNKAVGWLKKGDEAGNLQCTYQITKHIKNGDGIEHDASKYFFYLNKAALGGYKEAYMELVNCYLSGIGTAANDNKAFEWCQKAAEVSVKGITALAHCYTYGTGTQRDYDKAFALYQKAAELGDAQAQYDLGICYRQGEGVEKNPLKAIEWYLKAAEQGHGGALNNLGIMYQHGFGVEPDIEKAAMYYLESAKTGYADGQFCIGLLYLMGEGVELNYAEAIKWFQAAAEQGEPDSMYHLAICHRDGLGVEKNFAKMASYLYSAADRNFQPAIDYINNNKIPRPEEN